jgi:hypothetical protein
MNQKSCRGASTKPQKIESRSSWASSVPRRASQLLLHPSAIAKHLQRANRQTKDLSQEMVVLSLIFPDPELRSQFTDLQVFPCGGSGSPPAFERDLLKLSKSSY